MDWIISNWDWIIGIGIPSILCCVGWWVYKVFWGDRKGWSARYRQNSDFYMGNDLQKTLIKANKLFWRSPLPQKIGDCYQIDLGKERIISGFYEIDIERDNEVPAKYTLKLYNKGGIRESEPNHLVRNNIYGVGRVHQEFPATKVQRIEIMISKPTLDDNGQPYHWKIYGFELTEVMFFGHFIKRRI